MRFREARTIKAIGELGGSYPYVAALLSYVVVERVLKRYAVDHWTDPSYASATIPSKIKRHGTKQVSQLRRLTRRKRLHEILSKMTLGEVEILLRRPQREKSAPDRNEAMHSNLYLREESTLPKAKQQAKNKARLEKALNHLRRVLDQFEGLALVEEKRVLKARPNRRLELPKRGP